MALVHPQMSVPLESPVTPSHANGDLPLPSAEDIALYDVHFSVHSEDGFVSAMGA